MYSLKQVVRIVFKVFEKEIIIARNDWCRRRHRRRWIIRNGAANVQKFDAMRGTHPTGRYQNRHAYTEVNLRRKKSEIDEVFATRLENVVTFWALSEQHDSLHFVSFRFICWSAVDVVVVVVVVVVVAAVVVAVAVKGVFAFCAGTRVVLPATWFGVAGTLSTSFWLNRFDVDICGLLECKMFVKPPPANDPFGESPVTTTDGALTRRGLKIAGISLFIFFSLSLSDWLTSHETDPMADA